MYIYINYYNIISNTLNMFILHRPPVATFS